VLDQLSDTDSVLDRKSSAKPVNVEGSIRHLSQDDLEAYANGRLASTRLSSCQTHLDSCEACRAELEDIRNLQTELASFARPETNRSQPERNRRRRSLALPLTASVAAILVAGVGTFFWWRHGSLSAHKTLAAVPVAQPAAPAAVPATLTASAASLAPTSVSPKSRDPHLASAPATPAALHVPVASAARGPSVASRVPVASPAPSVSSAPAPSATPVTSPALTASVRPAAPNALVIPTSSPARAAPPAPTTASLQSRDAHLAATPPAANTGFSLLGPFGEPTSETRPQFSWQPLPGAIGYRVTIVDLSLHPVQHSPALRATTWRPRRALAHGRTYLWQVTATLHGGAKVVASSPTPSAALLQITPRHPKRS
jgi:anti-sigma factor RsiW